MEPLVFAIIAARTGYNQTDGFVPEPAEFLPFDLRALKRSHRSETNQPTRPSSRQGSLITQVAS
jgi:hypothetical protein